MGKVKTGIVVVVLVALIGGYYFYLSNRLPEEDNIEVTAVQEVILRDLEKNYPPTPKEVVRYYSEISRCLHNETYTQEQFEQMADKMLALYDEELLEVNPREQYLITLQGDVENFVESGYAITSFSTSSSTDVETSVVNGRECAKLYCTYTIQSGANYSSTMEVFELRKEVETGHWKILGFQIATPQQ